ncbi:MAG TPA: ABC transporter permease [Chitinophagaceae bacterium]|nr:ABC transporter permease [Chitinophagaceae bacterium]
MFKSYLKIALRNIVRHKAYSFVNILGLSLGICACIAIYTIADYELSFDTFHPGGERIYRIMANVTEKTGEKFHFARVPQPVITTGRNDLTGLENIAGYIPYYATITVPGNDGRVKTFSGNVAGSGNAGTIIAEPQYFNLFSYTWLAGNKATALQAPYSVVLTKSRALQYFGKIPLSGVIGKQVVYNDSVTAVVTGIVKDWTEKTDLGYTDFISFSSLNSGYLKNNITTGSWKEHDMDAWVFVKLARGTTPTRLNAELAGLVNKYAGNQINLSLWLEPLNDIHFNADVIENPIRTANLPTLYILMAVALFILALGIINFINLSTAQSIQRAKETGIRKVLGSSKKGLIALFLVETFMLTLVAVILSAALAKPVLAAFKSFIPGGISFHLFSSSTLIFLAVIIFITPLLAGLYPAKVLSSYSPVISLKATGTQKGSERWLMRKTLTVFQFTISLLFVTGSIIITKQLNYTRSKYPGFSSNAILTVDAPRGDSAYKIRALAEKFKQVAGIERVALQWIPPMTSNSRGMQVKLKNNDVKEMQVTQVDGNEDYIPLYEVKLLAGRNLRHADTVNEFVINESMLHLMGKKNPADALGETIYWNNIAYPVVGVVADFHTKSLHDPITPACIINRQDREGSFAIKLASKGQDAGEVQKTISRAAEAWKEIYPNATFAYKFYDETLDALYEKDRQTATLMKTSMAVTIFISCIGLFGLALFTTRRRAKEIGIRKVLGASITQISAMLTKDFAALIIIALLIASPLAWYVMHLWLQGFAYHITINTWVFVMSGIIAIGIMLVTVGYQSIKAAIANPVNALRSE